MPAETAALRELTGRGILTSAWTPGHPGAVLMVDLPDAEGADDAEVVIGTETDRGPWVGALKKAC